MNPLTPHAIRYLSSTNPNTKPNHSVWFHPCFLHSGKQNTVARKLMLKPSQVIYNSSKESLITSSTNKKPKPFQWLNCTVQSLSLLIPDICHACLPILCLANLKVLLFFTHIRQALSLDLSHLSFCLVLSLHIPWITHVKALR